MSEERLKEIKDSIDFQLRLCEINKYDNDMIIEELELYNEVIRLNEKIELITENIKDLLNKIACLQKDK